MIITVDRHVGIPFLEGLCADLQTQIQKKQEPVKKVRRNFRMPNIRWQAAVSRAATVACAVAGTLLALLEFHPV